MSVELISVLIAMLAVGATLAGLIVSSNRGLRKDMARDGGAAARRHEAAIRARGAGGA